MKVPTNLLSILRAEQNTRKSAADPRSQKHTKDTALILTVAKLEDGNYRTCEKGRTNKKPQLAWPKERQLPEGEGYDTWIIIANVIAWVFNAAMTFIFASDGGDLIINPEWWAFAVVWTLIFGLELGFVVKQIVQVAVRGEVLSYHVRVMTPWWVWTCIAQGFWNVAFFRKDTLVGRVFDYFLISSVLICLIGLNYTIDAQPEPLSVFAYLVDKLGFAIHQGWMFFNMAISLTGTLFPDGGGAAGETTVALITIFLLISIEVIFLFSPQWHVRPDPGFFAACAFSFAAIAAAQDELTLVTAILYVGAHNSVVFAILAGVLRWKAEWLGLNVEYGIIEYGTSPTEERRKRLSRT